MSDSVLGGSEAKASAKNCEKSTVPPTLTQNPMFIYSNTTINALASFIPELKRYSDSVSNEYVYKKRLNGEVSFKKRNKNAPVNLQLSAV